MHLAIITLMESFGLLVMAVICSVIYRICMNSHSGRMGIRNDYHLRIDGFHAWILFFFDGRVIYYIAIDV